MVKGIEKFREHFAGFEDQYVIIGGAACDLLFDAAGLAFRATKDIDLVLCVEVVDATFGARFKTFLDAGGYQARERSDGRREFYRFLRPTDGDFPFMVELFTRKPGALEFGEDAKITPIPVDEDVISLSAILLDDEYYKALQSARRQVGGVTILDETLLIPFKAKAFLNLGEYAAQGGRVQSDDIKKHRNDVFRLLRLLPGDAAIEVTEAMRDDLRRFLDRVAEDETFDPKTFDVPMSCQEGAEFLRSAYMLDRE